MAYIQYMDRLQTYCSVLDVRPRLRFNVGIRNGEDMLSILTAGSLLPIEQSVSLTCSGGDSVKLRIYQGYSERVSRNKQVHSMKLDFESEEREKGVKLTLDVTKDGKINSHCKWNKKSSKAKGRIGERLVFLNCPVPQSFHSSPIGHPSYNMVKS